MLHATITGDGTENILFIHGFPMNHSIWEAQLQALSHNFKCFAIDLPGYGKSKAPAIYEASIDSFADSLYEFILSKKISPVHIVGVSMGGMITLNMVRRYPDILKSITLLHTNAAGDSASKKAERDQVINVIKKGGLSQFIEEFADFLLSPKSSIEVRRKYISIMNESPEDIVISGLRAIRDRTDETDNLQHIKVPTLVVAGEDDLSTTPQLMTEMADLIPGSIYKLIPSCGHMSPLEQPERLSEILVNWISTNHGG